MVKENVRDYTRLQNGKVYGSIYYTYTSPTHWGSDGLCEITVDFRGDDKPEARLSYSAGGWNKGFTHLQIAEAMTEAFTLAAQRLNVLEHCPWQCQVS